MVFGTFDFLHQGHLHMFTQARKHGDYLIVIIARDKTVKTIKGKHPIKSEKLRQKIVAKYVDKAVLGNKKDKFGALRRYKPDVVCLGYDQVVFVDEMKLEVKQQGLKTKVVRLKSHKPNVFKSSIMAKK